MDYSKGSKVIFWALLALFVLITAVFLIGLSAKPWSYTPEVRPADIIGLAFTAAVYIFVAWYIAARIASSRSGKDIRIADLKEIETTVKNVVTLCCSPGNNDDILLGITQLHILINRYEKLSASEAVANAQALKDRFFDFYRAATAYDSATSSSATDLPLILHLSDRLILEVRGIIVAING